MDQPDKSEQFVQQLTANQSRIYGYVYSLLGNHTRAADVLQETNLVLWRKIADFSAEKPFLPWAFAVARFQVMAHLRDHKRDRLLLNAELAEQLSREVEQQAEQIDAVRVALRHCLQLLPAVNRQLVEDRHMRGVSVATLAESVDRSVGAIKVALLRTRRQLADCVQKRLAAEGLPR